MIPQSHQVNISVDCYKRSTTTRFLLAVSFPPATVAAARYTSAIHSGASVRVVTLEVTGMCR